MERKQVCRKADRRKGNGAAEARRQKPQGGRRRGEASKKRGRLLVYKASKRPSGRDTDVNTETSTLPIRGSVAKAWTNFVAWEKIKLSGGV